MKTKIVIVIIVILLVGCSSAPTADPVEVRNTAIAIVQTNDALTQAAMPTVAFPPSPTIYYLPTFPPPTPVPTYPTATPQPTPLINEQMYADMLTSIAKATPIRTPIPETYLDKTKVYIRGGNLFFRSSIGQIRQLTHSGIDRDPILSDDGQKIVFYRGENDDNVFSINTDGSNEQLIVTSKLLSAHGEAEIKALTFVPKTHRLLFNTYLCGPRPTGPSYNAPDCTVDIYSIDTDTNETAKQLIAGLSGNRMHDRNFEVSPDGKYFSVAASGHIDIYVGSDIVYPNAIVYTITRPDEYLPKQYWLPDSSSLIAIVSTDPYNEPGTAPFTYAAYRYTLGGTVNQIPLDKVIIKDSSGYDSSCISPDRKWLLFAGNNTGSPYETGFHYLGNLINGHTQAYEPMGWPLYSCQWSPDSKHFVTNPNTINFIGSVDGSLPIPLGGHFLEWIDNTHYLYVVGTTADNLKTYIGTIE